MKDWVEAFIVAAFVTVFVVWGTYTIIWMWG